MENEAHSQLELFSKPGNSCEQKKAHNSFLGYVRTYEKIIVLVICFVIAGIVLFSLGVEKGRKLVTPKEAGYLPENTAVAERVVQKQEIPDSKTSVPVQYAAVPSTSSSAPVNKRGQETTQDKIKSKYTIQLASYKSKALAQREAEVLKKRGFTPLILSKGAYTLLYVGNFANKEMAKTLLEELKKKYPDSFIRRL